MSRASIQCVEVSSLVSVALRSLWLVRVASGWLFVSIQELKVAATIKLIRLIYGRDFQIRQGVKRGLAIRYTPAYRGNSNPRLKESSLLRGFRAFAVWFAPYSHTCYP